MIGRNAEKQLKSIGVFWCWIYILYRKQHCLFIWGRGVAVIYLLKVYIDRYTVHIKYIHVFIKGNYKPMQPCLMQNKKNIVLLLLFFFFLCIISVCSYTYWSHEGFIKGLDIHVSIIVIRKTMREVKKKGRKDGKTG